MAKERLALTPTPTDGAWDWKRRYWQAGSTFVLPAQRVPLLSRDEPVEVLSWSVNDFGRVTYRVVTSDGRTLDVSLEEILGTFTPGPGSTLYAAPALSVVVVNAEE